MSCTIHSFSIVGNVPSYNAALGRADLQVKYPFLSPPFPPREFAFGEFCISLSGSSWASVWTSHGITLCYSSQHKMKTLCCGLWSPAKKKKSRLGKGKIKEEGGKKKVPLISLTLPLLFPKQSFMSPYWFFFSPCFNIIKNLDSLSLRFHISILEVIPFFFFFRLFFCLFWVLWGFFATREDLLFPFKKLQLWGNCQTASARVHEFYEHDFEVQRQVQA